MNPCKTGPSVKLHLCLELQIVLTLTKVETQKMIDHCQKEFN